MPALDDLANMVAVGAPSQQGSGDQAVDELPSVTDNILSSLLGPLLPTQSQPLLLTHSSSSSQPVASSSSTTQSSSLVTSHPTSIGFSSSSSASSSHNVAVTVVTATATEHAPALITSAAPAPDTPSTVTVSTGSSSAAFAKPTPSAATNAADTAPKSFLANKPLSISVIAVGSVLGVILLVLVGTWAMRKRRRQKLGNFADELSSDRLSGLGSGASSTVGHGTSDVEKGATANRGWGVDVIDKMEAVGGARSEGASYGVGAATTRGLSQVQRGVPLATYGQPPYPSRNVLHGIQEPYAQLPPRAVARVTPPLQRAVYQHQPMVAQTYDQPPTTYAAPYAPSQQQQQYPSPTDISPTESFHRGSRLPNPFEGAEPPMSQSVLYDLAHAPLQPQLFTIGTRNVGPVQRKPPPPFLTVDTAISPLPGPLSAGSLNGSPMKHALYSANPDMPVVESPQERAAPPRRSSLLDGPSTPKTPTSGTSRRHSRKASAASLYESSAVVLHPGPPPVAPPLPDEFGVPLSDSPRVLKVVNV
ncbi:hypothetical protein BC835DRAFT_1055211 [Cytidiella melzeri]|nr:hypothetical protein BC835DRAFT_1055211 [Cytidiella melzeri]